MKRIVAFSVIALLGLAPSAWAQSQTNGAGSPLSQSFRIRVPKNITITCPDIVVEHTHDASDANQVFPDTQSWVVKGNSTKGVTVTFTLDSPFTLDGLGSTDNDKRRDASLTITPGATQGPATWTSATQTIATDAFGGTLNASYSAESDGVGRAIFDLDMTFVNTLNGEGFGSYQEGTYITTVTGEVTEKP